MWGPLIDIKMHPPPVEYVYLPIYIYIYLYIYNMHNYIPGNMHMIDFNHIFQVQENTRRIWVTGIIVHTKNIYIKTACIIYGIMITSWMVNAFAHYCHLTVGFTSQKDKYRALMYCLMLSWWSCWTLFELLVVWDTLTLMWRNSNDCTCTCGREASGNVG